MIVPLLALLAQAMPPPPPGPPPPPPDVGVDEKLGARLPRELLFTDERGRSVRLGDRLEGTRPILLTLIYYHCPMLCDLVLQGLVRGLVPLGWRPGRDFTALTVSIDPKDRPAQAALKQTTVLQAVNAPDAQEAWPFLVGDAATIERLAAAIGFRYVHDRASDQYAHPAVAVVLAPDGRVSRYLYGLDVRPVDLRLALTEAAAGRSGRVLDRVLLTCFRYDPSTRRYGLLVTLVIEGGAALVLIAVAVALTLLVRHDRARQRAAARGVAC